MTTDTDYSQKSIALGLAFVAGVGLTLMMLALGWGVVGGAEANGDAVGLMLAIGAALLVGGLITWIAVVQPHKNFDDINVPMYTGHHESEH